MTFPTANEQLFLELVNRARAHPTDELARFNAWNDQARTGDADMASLLDGLQMGQITAAPKQPLAFVPVLGDAAIAHSRDMVERDYFEHVGLDGRTPSQRGLAAGWDPGSSGWSFAENLAFSGHSVSGWAQAVDTVLLQHYGLFHSPGHRVNLLADRFSETGVGQAFGAFTIAGITYSSSSLLTQKFADAGRVFLTGVAIDDRDADSFYDVGEGLAGIEVAATGAAGTFATTTWGSGGYAIELPTGDYTVTFSGGGLPAPVVRSVTIGSDNVKVDARVQDVDPGFGSDGALRLVPGQQSLSGGPGLDTLVVVDGRSSVVVALLPDGTVSLRIGAQPPVVLTSIERIRLDDAGVAFDTDGAAGRAYRIYEAALDRAPDEGGLGYWIGVLDAGASLRSVAAAFVASPEFVQRYGSLNDASFVDLLYRNVLERPADPDGSAFWVGELSGGMSREVVLEGFSESAENRVAVASAIQDGIWFV